MKTINIMKRIIFIALLGLGIASCSKDDKPVTKTNPVAVDYHQTAPTKFITADGTKYAYRVLGDKTGVPLVMLSSLGFSMDEWDPAITNGLAQQYKVILVDVQGVGKSGGTTPNNIPDMAKGIVSFIKALGYSKVNLLGFSMGSFISQQIVLTEPALVNKIILTGTGPKGAEGLLNLPNLLASTAGLDEEHFLLKFAFTSSPESVSAGKLSYERIQKRTSDRDLPVSAESTTAEVIAVLGWGQPYPNALTELKSITQPVLIAQGEDDLAVPVINAISMSQNIPNAKLVVYPDAGHAAAYQYPDQFVSLALEFLKK